MARGRSKLPADVIELDLQAFTRVIQDVIGEFNAPGRLLLWLTRPLFRQFLRLAV